LHAQGECKSACDKNDLAEPSFDHGATTGKKPLAKLSQTTRKNVKKQKSHSVGDLGPKKSALPKKAASAPSVLAKKKPSKAVPKKKAVVPQAPIDAQSFESRLRSVASGLKKYEQVKGPVVAGGDDEVDGTTWANLKRVTEQAQHFGVEAEIKRTNIPYGFTDVNAKIIPDRTFLDFAVKKGHKGVFRCTVPGIGLEFHLDQGTGAGREKGALLELVTYPPQTAAALAESLAWARKNIPKDVKALKEHLAVSGKWERKHKEKKWDNAYLWLIAKLKVSSRGNWFPNIVQVTTTNTAAALAKIAPALLGATQGFDVKTLTEAKMTEFLCGMPAFEDNGKGTAALVKHACQQFNPDVATTAKDDTVIDKLTAGQNYELRTMANKLAPLFKRSDGKWAYVVEYRGGSGKSIETDVGKWLNSNDRNSVLKIYYPNNAVKHNVH